MLSWHIQLIPETQHHIQNIKNDNYKKQFDLLDRIFPTKETEMAMADRKW